VVTEELKLKGIYATGKGEPLLLLNTLTERDIMEISRPFMTDPGSLDPATWKPDTITHAGFRTALYLLKNDGDTALEGASIGLDLKKQFNAIKYYYDLLRHPYFTWEPQAENILVDQTAVAVDYLDERKFAAAAAAKARTGAEIVNLTYRQHYTEDPEGQWQGYKDPDTARAWGVDGWARRSGQGAFFDWVVGNAILPAEDGENEGIAKIDRTTVVELREIASRYNDTQAQVDQVDVGLNPLGVAKGSVPFDIDPGQIDSGQTHFEQIYGRAVDAMNNAIAVFNHANQSTQLLRRQQDSLADFQRNIENMEADYNNRLVEVFGYPYPEDCGPGKTYSTQYCDAGPDLYHYMYVDPSELMGVQAPKTYEFPVTFKNIDVDASGALQEEEQEVFFHVATDIRFGLIKPEEWIGRRKAPGEVQLARSDLLQSRGRFEKALKEYDNLLGHIEKQADLIEAQHGLNAEEIKILNAAKARQENLNSRIKGSRTKQLLFRKMGSSAVLAANALAEAPPSVVGLIIGMASGAITDVTAPIRSGIKIVGQAINEIMTGIADLESLSELDHQQAKEIASAETNIKLTALRGGFAVEQQLLQLENLIRTEVTLRYEIYNLAESMQQTAGRYLSAMAKGERLIEDRRRFRRQTAAQVQDYRYKDMTFRIFRNDALEKYRAQFDMAARYVYLAAKAYDYETTLLDYDTMAGQAFLTDIVKQRTIGMIANGQPLTGSGLADPMKRMWQNFQVIKPQLGFNNPQVETNRFSLRQEMFRIKMDQGSNENWRNTLRAHVVDDLWKVEEFRRYCRPFAEEGGAQPAIVIPFSTTVTSGLNFYRWLLGGGDSYYSATNFATKVRSVGVWFSNYNSVGLVQTPRIYLIPAGEDILRTPSYNTKDIRTWHVVDQKLPIPFPLTISEVESNPNWIPTVDTIFDEMFEIRRHSDFRAYHDSGYMNQSEMIYDSRLVGRSVWNTNWVLIIPGKSLIDDAEEGIETFIDGLEIPGGTGERNGRGISDIKLFFETYAYSGN
jgi:tetratricopeptide (TPR) repeat protein